MSTTSKTRTIHSVLAAAAAIDEADSPSAAMAAVSSGGSTVSRAALAVHLQGAAALIPGLGDAILKHTLAKDGSRVDFNTFLRVLDRISCPEDAMERCQVMYDVLSSLVRESGSVADAATGVLQHCFVIERSLSVANTEPFRCAAAQAAIMTATSELSACRRGFAEYAMKHLPGVVSILANHVWRLCAASDGLEAATLAHEAAQRSQGLSSRRQLDVQTLLRMPTDDARRLLAEHTKPAPRSSRGPGAPTASASAATSSSSGAVEPMRGPAPLLCEEWLWLISQALELPTADRPVPAASDWGVLFSSTSDGRSLHTLDERTSGYTDGALLVGTDAGGFCFAAWCPNGINPSPPSTTAPPRALDYFGSERTALMRLRPTLIVCRSRRSLASDAAATAAGAPAAGCSYLGHVHSSLPPSRRTSCTSSAVPSVGPHASHPLCISRHDLPMTSLRMQVPSAGPALAVPADMRYIYFNNKRSQGKRGLGLGGSFKSFRLFVDASLESGSARDSCDTFADGALTSGAHFEIRTLEVWGCGGQSARRAQEEWKEERGESRRRAVRRAITGNDGVDPAERASGGGLTSSAGILEKGKEESWILGLLGLFGSSSGHRQ